LTISITRTVKSSLVENLRDQILQGQVIPGQYLRLEEIASQYDVSTTPVREALRALESEGLVTIYPHRGAIVTKLSVDDLRDIYDIRATLEAMATRLAVPNLTAKEISHLVTYTEQMDNHLGELLTLVKLNHQFHISLYKASGRRHLCELTTVLRYRTQHYLHAFITHLGGMSLAQTEHHSIVDACKQGDADQAAAIVFNHVNHVGSSLIEYVRQLETIQD